MLHGRTKLQIGEDLGAGCVRFVIGFLYGVFNAATCQEIRYRDRQC